jgi:hypothetical protein
MNVGLTLLGLGVLLTECASTPPPPPAPAVAAPEVTRAAVPNAQITAEPQVACDLVCERAQIVPRPADGPDHHARATENANAVLGAMHGDLLACYKKRVAVSPQAHAFITVDIVIDEAGLVRKVETTGGALLGESTMDCLVQRIRRASFEPPHGGGTLRIHVPFSLRRVAPGDDAF